ncbi:hypothetical protein AB0M38_16650 [Streptomyces sp. NPDC051742]|uniref:Uncharacterized protein n=1 Tax=Streptomyces zaomyceticus TaxID=68286 RepID=A0ABZ1L5X0_9ACTN|nr:hypothetical protein OG237_33965 [Streptomyces zaomyceticus]
MADDNEGDESVTSITEDVLLEKATKFEELLLELTSDTVLLALPDWSAGKPNGDFGQILPGNPKQLNSAARVQAGFAAVCTQLEGALDKLQGVTKSGSINLRSVKEILGDAAGDAVDVTEMWEILGMIQRDAQQSSGSTPSPEK